MDRPPDSNLQLLGEAKIASSGGEAKPTARFHQNLRSSRGRPTEWPDRRPTARAGVPSGAAGSSGSNLITYRATAIPDTTGRAAPQFQATCSGVQRNGFYGAGEVNTLNAVS
jgi:hypothetical protein